MFQLPKWFNSGLDWLLEKEPPKERIIIMTPYGPVTEVARLTAALNMRDFPDIKARVMAMLEKEMGSPEKAEAEARRRYPEAYSNGQ